MSRIVVIPDQLHERLSCVARSEGLDSVEELLMKMSDSPPMKTGIRLWKRFGASASAFSPVTGKCPTARTWFGRTAPAKTRVRRIA